MVLVVVVVREGSHRRVETPRSLRKETVAAVDLIPVSIDPRLYGHHSSLRAAMRVAVLAVFVSSKGFQLDPGLNRGSLVVLVCPVWRQSSTKSSSSQSEDADLAVEGAGSSAQSPTGLAGRTSAGRSLLFPRNQPLRTRHTFRKRQCVLGIAYAGKCAARMPS